MAKALMIGGGFLLARDPRGLAQWYQRHLGWELGYLADESAYSSSCTTAKSIGPTNTSTWCSRSCRAIRATPGEGHVINYGVDDVDAIVARMQEDGVETSPVTVGPDAEGQGKFVRLLDPEGHRIELWEHLSDGS
jgi:glyoxylase I family protein